MEVTPSRKLPYFSQYLAYEVVESKKLTRSAWKFNIAGVGFIGAIAVMALSYRFLSIPPWLSIPVMAGGWSVAMVQLDKWLRRPRNADEVYRQQVDDVMRRYVESMNRRRLHREMDSTAAQLLEATAYYWCRIREQLDSTSWHSETTPTHLRGIRYQTLLASDEAMREQMALCLRCLISPGQKKSTDLRDVLEDTLGIDVDKILDRLSGTPLVKKGIQSEHLPEIFDDSRHLAERLKQLCSEVERMTVDNVRSYQGQGSGATASIDNALRGLQEVKVAEAELSETDQVQGKL